LALLGQTAVPDSNGRLVFKANARIVVVDVVATGRDGRPVDGLRKEDFALAEDGAPQQILSFEEHSGAQAMATTFPELPPNVFTNMPRVKPIDAVTVLLLDSMNTPIEDQGRVRAELLKFLATVRPGRRIAIFTLGTRLRFVEGFSDDPAILAAALGNPLNGSKPRASALLTSESEKDANQQSVGNLYADFAANPSSVNLLSLQSVQQFQAEQETYKVDERVHLTLDALQQLCRYLAGIPGRKNVVWFSGGFPLNLFPNPELQDSFVTERKYERETLTTDALLSAAEVAIYPVDAVGNFIDSLYAADRGFNGKINMQEAIQAAANHPGQPQSQSLGEQAQGMMIDSLQKDSVQRNADHTAMDGIAGETGGEAFYNTNGLEGAVSRVIDRGSHYYTLTYAPGNPATDGKYRRIAVKATTADGVKLAYRRGYFAAGPKVTETAAAKPTDDPLHPFMGPGMPSSTQIVYALRVKTGPVPTTLEPTPEMQQHSAPTFAVWGKMQSAEHTDLVPGFENSTPSRAGDNPKLKGKLTRFTVDFVIAARGLQLAETPNGGRRGAMESTLVAYGREGKPLNWLVRRIDVDLDAARYAEAQQNGINFRQEIDVPKDAATLRSGVLDLGSGLAGTLEIPIANVLVGQAPGLKSR
jgi:VWFA-related protein